SYELDIELFEPTIAANQLTESSTEHEYSDSDQGYDSLPSFHCNMIRSSYEHPFIAPGSIVLKQKLDTLKQELATCPPHMVNRYYSLQPQVYELKNQLDAKIQQEKHEDLQLASRTTPSPETSFAPYQFSLPPGRGRGRSYPSSFGRGRGSGPRHFPFLFPEEEEHREESMSMTRAAASQQPQQIVSNPVPAPDTPERRFWRQARLSLLERAIQKATEEF
ncbi:hypothetical protein KI387_010401, partial [Taxus chinensis]